MSDIQQGSVELESETLDSEDIELADEQGENNELEQQRVIEEVNRVVQIAGQEGNLRERLNLTDVKGTNLELVNSINGLLQNISAPIFELKNSIGMMAQGDISQSYDASMAKGDIKEIGEAYNTAIKNLNNLLGNINGIANLVAASSEELLTKADQMQGTTNEMSSAISEMAEGAHQQASAAAYKHQFFSESLFVRMQVQQMSGVWQGRPFHLLPTDSPRTDATASQRELVHV
jgi:methyl-accepting chemotaxis protein